MLSHTPAGLDGVVFASQGCLLLGGFYRAAGSGPRPTAILCHGVPGVEKNLDLAYGLRDAGWNVLYFHYRGSWGSAGTYSFTGLTADLRAATEWALRQPGVDQDRLAYVGGSLGGYAVLAEGAREARVSRIVALCPLLDGQRVPMPRDLAVQSEAMLRGVTADELQRQWGALPPIASLVERLRGPRLLLVTGDRDELFPPEHYTRLAPLLPEMRWERFPLADHGFSECRPQLVQTVVNWLITQE